MKNRIKEVGISPGFALLFVLTVVGGTAYFVKDRGLFVSICVIWSLVFAGLLAWAQGVSPLKLLRFVFGFEGGNHDT